MSNDHKVSKTINNISIKVDSNGQFVDVFDKDSIVRITDYSLMDEEIMVDKANELQIGSKKEKYVLSKQEQLMRAANLFIEVALGSLNHRKNSMRLYKFEYKVDDFLYDNKPIDLWLKEEGEGYKVAHFNFEITKEEKQLLAEQLVFDMLYDFYLNNAPQMTVDKYIRQFEKKHNATSIVPIRGTLQNGMKQYSEKMLEPKYKDQLKLLGIDAEIYSRYYLYNDKRGVEKPKYVWDRLFYNKYMITAKQYRRQLTKKSRNNPYWELYQHMSDYHNFVVELLPEVTDYGDVYLNKIMDYYELESYKRIDFMCKIVIKLPDLKAEDVEFIIRRFHPEVMIVSNDNGNIRFGTKNNYYRPMLIIEDLLLNELSEGEEKNIVGQKLIKYQVIRAKAFEIMKYHTKIEEINYRDVEAFLRKSFDMCAYHQLNKAWSIIDGCEYNKKNEEEKVQIIKIIKQMIDLNKVLFK